MYRRFNGTIAALISLPLMTTGCVQATRHSNTMIFGTNTSVGLKVGTDVAEIPGILVGYNRQEAVILPLVANTASTSATGTAGKTLNRLDPCDIKTEIKVVTDDTPPQTIGKLEPHPCLLVAIDKDGKARDSYSVLASFGANFGASQGGTGVNAQGGLAQYFATGMAAQLLALNGGAAVVATGEAAKKSVEEPKMTLTGLTPTSAETAAVKQTQANFDTAIKQLSAKVRLTPDDKLAANIQAFEKAITSAIGLDKTEDCKKHDSCADLIATKDYYAAQFRGKHDDFMTALNAYPTVK